MKKSKLSLNDLKIKSFVTSNTDAILGGAPTTVDFTNERDGYCVSDDGCGGPGSGSGGSGGVPTDQLGCDTVFGPGCHA